MGGRRSNILSGVTRDWLLERVTSDFTLRGLVAELGSRDVKVDYVQVWRFAQGLSGFPCVSGRLNITPPWP